MTGDNDSSLKLKAFQQRSAGTPTYDSVSNDISPQGTPETREAFSSDSQTRQNHCHSFSPRSNSHLRKTPGQERDQSRIGMKGPKDNLTKDQYLFYDSQRGTNNPKHKTQDSLKDQHVKANFIPKLHNKNEELPVSLSLS